MVEKPQSKTTYFEGGNGVVEKSRTLESDRPGFLIHLQFLLLCDLGQVT